LEKYVDINAQLIDDCRQGSSKAQFAIYKLYYKAMYNTSFRIVGSSAEAEDVMQDAFLSAFNNIDNYRGEVSFGAWLKRIVVNRSLDVLRRRREMLLDVDESFANLPDNDSLQLDTVDTTKAAALIRDVIMNMPDNYRVLLSLYLLEGYTHDEIAQILGMTDVAVRTGYSRAKKKLQETLKNTDIWTN